MLTYRHIYMYTYIYTYIHIYTYTYIDPKNYNEMLYIYCPVGLKQEKIPGIQT
jgi:hypothetical protein